MKNKLPDCQLVEVLRRKSDARTDVEFDYIGELVKLRQLIGAEVRFINQLFPEYTPHDEEYHLSRLFHVADTIIESTRYENMNVTELFVLACGLYGHDWGMAVSEVEKEYIIFGTLPDGFSPSDFALLHDEHNGFVQFIKNHGLEIDEIKNTGIEIEHWREYVRATHAFRSGTRIRQYFQKIDPGAGEAAARVCEGHWLNIEDLEDARRFPTNFAVLRENLDLAAIAVYVRLVDLLDIGHDRTPYVIWKFVAPRNSYSKMEWDKHRALQPITCPTYLKGRIVMVDGSTDDHEVFAALEDLRNYCDKQLRECMNLLAQIADERDLLDLYHIEWRVVANGFDPVLVRFEFDRDKVFEILSNEIYQGDAYVFLRELLQNSIDAIRTRRELLQKSGINPQSFGLIKVDVEHQSGRAIKVTWTDDGVGIDEHVLRNYLAVAGRSYYQSKDFEREGLSFDPISRFGIGILSCFMAGDVVEIETQKDPYASHALASSPLRVKIPSVTGQFRVEKTLPHDFGIGTRVRVFIDENKLPEGFDVTRYLRIVAAFSEFPILISEQSKRSVILHPESVIDVTTDVRFAHFNDLDIHKIDMGYPIEDAVLPQDLELARLMCVEEQFDIRRDLGLDSCEGRIIYLGIRNHNVRALASDSGIFLYDFDDEETGQIRWRDRWDWYGYTPAENPWVKSATPKPTYAVYRDGILVPGAELPREMDGGFSNKLARRRIIVNFWRGAPELSISRVQLRIGQESWFDPIEGALNQVLEKRLARDITSVKGLSQFASFGWAAATYNLSKSFVNSANIGNCPVPMLDGDRLTFQPWVAFRNKEISVVPSILAWSVGDFVRTVYEGSPYSGLVNLWRGHGVIIHATARSVALNSAFDVLQLALARTHILTSVVLLKSPGPKFPPLVQEVWQPRQLEKQQEIRELAARGIDNPLGLTAEQRELLTSTARHYRREYFLSFPEGPQSPFRVGDSYYNLNHPVAALVFRCLCWQVLAKQELNSDAVAMGLMTDALSGFDRWSLQTQADEVVNRLVERASDVGLSIDSKPLRIAPDELWYRDDSGYQFHESVKELDQEFGYSV